MKKIIRFIHFLRFIRFTITPPQNITGEQLISLQSHIFLSKGNRTIDNDNVYKALYTVLTVLSGSNLIIESWHNFDPKKYFEYSTKIIAGILVKTASTE